MCNYIKVPFLVKSLPIINLLVKFLNSSIKLDFLPFLLILSDPSTWLYNHRTLLYTKILQEPDPESDLYDRVKLLTHLRFDNPKFLIFHPDMRLLSKKIKHDFRSSLFFTSSLFPVNLNLKICEKISKNKFLFFP